jgi:choline transporter-like protein 2/4/5
MPANQVSPKQGEPVIDDDLANGPLGKRSCRDVLCCLLFIAFVGGMIGIGIWGYTQGKPTLIGRGYDADGKSNGFPV